MLGTRITLLKTGRSSRSPLSRGPAHRLKSRSFPRVRRTRHALAGCRHYRSSPEAAELGGTLETKDAAALCKSESPVLTSSDPSCLAAELRLLQRESGRAKRMWNDDVHHPDTPSADRAVFVAPTPPVWPEHCLELLCHPVELLGGQPEVSVLQDCIAPLRGLCGRTFYELSGDARVVSM